MHIPCTSNTSQHKRHQFLSQNAPNFPLREQFTEFGYIGVVLLPSVLAYSFLQRICAFCLDHSVLNQPQQVSQQDRNCNLSNRWYENASLLLDRRCIKVLVAREIDADCSISNQLHRDFELRARYTADHNVT
jgi:hypothetical protein